MLMRDFLITYGVQTTQKVNGVFENKYPIKREHPFKDKNLIKSVKYTERYIKQALQNDEAFLSEPEKTNMLLKTYWDCNRTKDGSYAYSKAIFIDNEKWFIEVRMERINTCQQKAL